MVFGFVKKEFYLITLGTAFLKNTYFEEFFGAKSASKHGERCIFVLKFGGNPVLGHRDTLPTAIGFPTLEVDARTFPISVSH